MSSHPNRQQQQKSNVNANNKGKQQPKGKQQQQQNSSSSEEEEEFDGEEALRTMCMQMAGGHPHHAQLLYEKFMDGGLG